MEQKEVAENLVKFDKEVEKIKSADRLSSSQVYTNRLQPFSNLSFNPASNYLAVLIMVLVFGGFTLAILYFLFFSPYK